jgi:two-component system phosphate regulon sensor histidine kinase PhoR
MRKRKKLFTQIFPTHFLIVAISLVAAVWFVFSSLNAFIVRQTKDNLTAQARLFGQQISLDEDYADPVKNREIDRLCKRAGRASHARFTVILPGGRVIGDSEQDPLLMENHRDRPEIAAAAKAGPGSSIRYSTTLKKNMMYVAVTVPERETALLTVRAAVPLTSVFQALAEVKGNIIHFCLLVALPVALISLLMSKKITRPVQEMKEGARRFAAGHLDRKLILPDSEELAGLAEAMNRMSEQLDERIKTIKRQKNELEAVFASMTEAVIAVDGNDRILRTNQAAESLLGTTGLSLQGKYLHEVIRNHDFIRFAGTAATVEKAEDDLAFEMKEEDVRVMNVRSGALIDETGSRIGTLLVLNDVTRVRYLEDMRKEFAANVSHEIRTPLTAIQGFAESLLADPVFAESKDGSRHLEIIVRNARRLSVLIEDVLRLSHIENGDRLKDFNFEPARISTVIDSAVNVCRPEADQKGIRVVSDCDPALTVIMDFSLAEQALINLLENAVKYSPENTEIRVEAARKDADIVIRVVDNGIGIPAVHIPRLFERFYRVDKTRSRKLGGTGLGLAIVKHIVQIHGWKMDVKSTPGKGSVFTITIPNTGERAPSTPTKSQNHLITLKP